VPTLVRVGDADQNVPLAMVKPIADAIPGARLEIVPGCGHLYLAQDAEGTVASVERFLRS
jgi:pimeloyl-ACP methyl ester carboxylesterase